MVYAHATEKKKIQNFISSEFDFIQIIKKIFFIYVIWLRQSSPFLVNIMN